MMGILNATPDSFSGDGCVDPPSLAARARALADEGADVLDLGGESTRPGAIAVSEQEELERVLPALAALRQEAGGLPISVDTTKAAVAEAAVVAGATIVNDVSGLRDARLAEIAARHGAWLVLMYNGRERQTTVSAAIQSLLEMAERAQRAGMPRERLIADPGIGFVRTPAENFELLRGIPAIKDAVGLPLLVGPSRKFGRGKPEATAAAVAIATFLGADVVRVHDVAGAVVASRVAAAIRYRTS